MNNGHAVACNGQCDCIHHRMQLNNKQG